MLSLFFYNTFFIECIKIIKTTLIFLRLNHLTLEIWSTTMFISPFFIHETYPWASSNFLNIFYMSWFWEKPSNRLLATVKQPNRIIYIKNFYNAGVLAQWYLIVLWPLSSTSERNMMIVGLIFYNSYPIMRSAYVLSLRLL